MQSGTCCKQDFVWQTKQSNKSHRLALKKGPAWAISRDQNVTENWGWDWGMVCALATT